MQPIDAVWIIGLIWIFWYIFIRKEKQITGNKTVK